MPTDSQKRVLRLLAKAHMPPTADEIGQTLVPSRQGRQDWARSRLVRLERAGLVERLGDASSGGRCWGITPAGREALAVQQ